MSLSFDHIFTTAAVVLLSACDLPITKSVDAASQTNPYQEDPTRPPVDDEDTAPWDFPYDAGHNPYVRTSDTFDVVNKSKPVDVLFVMDNSGSMSEEQSGVVDSFSTFLEGFTNERIDYHIGVVATDTRVASSWWTRAPYANFPNSGPGSLLAYTGNPRFISTEFGRSEAIRQFRLNASLGIQGSGAESGLLAVTKAVDPAKTATGAWNADFLRPDALLSIVLVSDEDESIGDANSRYIKRDAAAESTRINAFLSSIRALKPGRPDLLRLDVVIAPTQNECPTVGSDDGVLGIGETYAKAQTQLYQGATFPAGQVLNVCRDFSASLGNLGAQIAVQVERRFTLAKAVEGELKVFLDGQELSVSNSSGYTYVASSHSIELHGLDLENKDNFQVTTQYVAKK